METEVPLCLPPPPENLCLPPPPEYTAVFMQYHGFEGFVQESHFGHSEPHPRSGQALVPRNEAFPEGDVDPALLSLSVKLGEMQTREQALEVGVHAEIDSLSQETHQIHSQLLMLHSIFGNEVAKWKQVMEGNEEWAQKLFFWQLGT